MGEARCRRRYAHEHCTFFLDIAAPVRRNVPSIAPARNCRRQYEDDSKNGHGFFDTRNPQAMQSEFTARTKIKPELVGFALRPLACR